MRTCSQVCGVVFNPIEDDYVDVCEDCEGGDQAEDDCNASSSYYLGACGLIIDYLL
ncbi:hypothetical protein [Paenibacillus roseipurpureus]|uniref:Uncharacterized protein n=1 Tax=Paenibacillus roseopurpureus TaxID=2918901 RepID=A0AA96RPJ9_9BACL|nr:hypothetical protein [Paenibacillus sp. MBLB1832]WNR46732.1 hypothetical protein MJB10_11765 [Paenibacillus sp. MBLB1832]